MCELECERDSECERMSSRERGCEGERMSVRMSASVSVIVIDRWKRVGVREWL